jgi:hypothetical protein
MENHEQKVSEVWGSDRGDSSQALIWIQSAVARQAEEGLYLDFKQKKDRNRPALDDDDKANLAKSISGFANTDGGLIVWGVKAKADTKDDPDVATDCLPIKHLKAFLTTLNALSGDLVTPPVPGVENRAVPEAPNTDSGYVITIVPKRRDTLTQAAAKTCKGFYIRSGSGFHQLPPPLIAEFYKRRPSPLLRLYLEFAGPDQSKFFEQVRQAEHWEQAQHGQKPWGRCVFQQGLAVRWKAILRNEGLGSANSVVLELRVSHSQPEEWWLINYNVKKHEVWDDNKPRTLYEPHPSSDLVPQKTQSGIGRVLDAVHPGQDVLVASGVLRIPSEAFDGSIGAFEVTGSAFAMDSPPFNLNARYEGSELLLRYSGLFRSELRTAPPAVRTLDKPGIRKTTRSSRQD